VGLDFDRAGREDRPCGKERQEKVPSVGLLESEYDVSDPDVVSVIDDAPLWSAPFGLKLLEVVRMRKNIRVLDIGSGLGFPLIELAQRLGATCEVYGVDPWTPANERARMKIRVWRLKSVQVIPGNAEHLPFPDGSFELVVSNNGTNNVDDEGATFREIFRVAKPGAQIVLTMNLPKTMDEFYQVYRDALHRKNRNDELERLEAHIHHKRKPLRHTLALIESVGLEVVNVHHDSFSLRYSDGSAMLDSPFIKLAFLRSWTDVLAPSAVGPVFEVIEGELNRLAEVSGELRLTVPWVCLDLCKPS
jgi:ubiquinone/menaquinone biosynthesis C-methylase UbiE